MQGGHFRRYSHKQIVSPNRIAQTGRFGFYDAPKRKTPVRTYLRPQSSGTETKIRLHPCITPAGFFNENSCNFDPKRVC